jgi:ABC-2 type transport system permease protein
MLKKIYNLTLNEIIKQFKKKSILIVTILIFLSSIAIPIGLKLIQGDEVDYSADNYRYEIEEITKQISKINISTEQGKINVKFLESKKQYNQFLLDNEIKSNSWRYNYSQNYLRELIEIDIVELIKSGVNIDTISNVLPDDISKADFDEIKLLSKDKLNLELNKLNNKSSNIVKDIKTNNYKNYLKNQIGYKKDLINSYNKELSSLKKDVKDNNISNDIKTSIADIENKLNFENKLLKVIQYRYDNEISFDANSWKNKTLDDISQNIKNASAKIISEEDYKRQNIYNVTYAQYVQKYNSDHDKYLNNIKMGWYSLDKNIPMPKFESSARDAVNSLVGIYTTIASIIVIILAGGIVSSEFNRNTIKLLMIRPVSRVKIILSKFISVLLIGYFIMFGSMALVTIVNGFIFGFSDFAIPIIKMSAETVITQNYIISLFLNLIFYSISMIFIGSFAFVLSTVTKNTTVSVAVSIIILLGSLPVSAILLGKNIMWLTSTPMPYINLAAIPVMQHLTQVLGTVTVLDITLGAIELLVSSIIFVIMAFTHFIKNDITN